MIEVTHLTKQFGRLAAIDDLSFSVAAGEVVGFLGPNGAGKTTTMRILSTYMPASGGKARVCGFDVFSDSLDVRRHIGYLPENAPLYLEMRVTGYLRFRGSIKGMCGRHLHSRIGEVLELCDLRDVSNRIIGHLSKGYRQRVSLADALLHEPEVLILDEPTMGLDPNQIRHIRNLIRDLSSNHTILLSSHILPEVESVCQRVLIISKGRIVASDTPANLVRMSKGNDQVVAELQAAPAHAVPVLAKLDGVVAVRDEQDGDWTRYTCECEKEHDIRQAIHAAAVEHKWPVRELTVRPHRLEDFFADITMEAHDDTAS